MNCLDGMSRRAQQWSDAVKHFIALVLAAAIASSAVAAEGPVLYANDFEKAEVGKLSDDFLAIQGDFIVKAESGNKVLELPGTPLETFAALFGPTEKSDVAVGARILGTSKGRRSPTFGVGLNGAGGYKLQVSPGKKALELCKDQEIKTSAPFDWKSGQWTCFRLEVRKVKDGEWKVQGRAWARDEAEPDKWLLAFDETEEPVPGRASVLGSPFSGTPIQFDDLVVSRAGGK
jgi:hypothetical protein